MEEFSGKRATNGLSLSRKAKGLVFGENTSKKDDRDGSICRRFSCSARISSPKGAQIGSSDSKMKSAKPLFRTSSNGKEIVGSPSRTPSGFNNSKKPSKVSSQRQISSRADADSSENSSVHNENAVSKEAVSTGTGRGRHERSDMGTRNSLMTPSDSSSSFIKETIKSSLRGHRLRNPTINTVYDFGPSNLSSTSKINLFRKKNCSGESSSSRVVPEEKRENPPHALFISDSRRHTNPTRDRSVSATPQAPQPATLADTNTGLSSIRDSFMIQDGLNQRDRNEIEEVLAALERIEKGEVLSYEQLIILDSNVVISSMNCFYDQHNDMRLDIDNMSYEELLALEEKMGTVSTALSEEALSRSLETVTYKATDKTSSSTCVNKGDDNDVKCSICQEEYVGGEELGTLKCNHKYHMSCIQEWLGMKNWCPICKISAESPPPQPSTP